MGLDMYAYAYRNVPADCAWFGDAWKPEVGEQIGDEELYYWRKHPDLHRWMERLATTRGFTDSKYGFNGVWLRLTPEDLTQLESDLDAGLEENTGGFFFGASVYPEDAEATLEFIAKARALIESDGATIFYNSSW